MAGRGYERFGSSSFVYRDPIGVLLRLRNVVQEDGHIYGDVHVFADEPDGEHILMRRPKVNLTSDRTIGPFVKAAGSRFAWDGWGDLMEFVCATLMEEMDRKGEVTELLPMPEREIGQPTLWDDFAPASLVTALMANGGTGKTLIADALAISVAAGITVGPFVPHKKGLVLYCDWENNAKVHRRRLTRMCAGLGIPFPAGQIIHYHAQAPLRKCESELMELIQTRGVLFAVMDSIGPAAGGNLSDTEVATTATNVLKHLGITIVMLAHVSKASLDSDAGTAVTPIGSIMFHNLVHQAWETRPQVAMDGTITLPLYNTKQNVGARVQRPMGMMFEFVDPAGPITPSAVRITGDMDAGSGMSWEQRVLDALANVSGEVRQYEIAQALGITDDDKRGLATLKDTLYRLRKKGQLTNTQPVGRGEVMTWGLARVVALNERCKACGGEVSRYGADGSPWCDAHYVEGK